MPAQLRLQRVVDRLEERVDGSIAGRLGASLDAVDGQRDGPRRVAEMRRGDVPADERDARGHLSSALLDEGQQVGVGDLLLRIGKLDGLPVDHVERLAFEVVPSSRSLPCNPFRPDSLPIVSWLPDKPTDCGVMISYVSGC